MKQRFLIAIAIFIGLTSFSKKDRFHDSFLDDFKKHHSRYFKSNDKGKKADRKCTFGAESVTDPGMKILSLKIDPRDSAGAGKGPEVISKHFTGFGTYAARLRIPDVSKIQPDVGAVVGYFTYNVDKGPGLSEIDYEWLLADPEVIYIGTWTGQRGKLKRVGRTLNLAKGIIYTTEYKERPGDTISLLTGIRNQPETIPAIEGYNASNNFYTYGFDWYPDRIRWWMIHPATADTVVLWDYKGSQVGIPQNRSRYRLNFWYTNSWPVETNPKSIERPLHNYEVEADWMLYRPLKK
jgi:beta-glucanase (GH16 family)